MRAALRGSNHRVKREYASLPLLALVVDAHALNALNAVSGIVTSVVEDEVQVLHLAESVPIAYQPGGPWPGGLDGTGTVVAVLDSGVDGAHPFLAGKVIAEACFSTTSAISTNVCPGGVDSTAPGSGVNCTGAENCEHGTHVAGIVAGGDAGVAGSGVAPGAKLWAIQISSRFGASSCGGFQPCVAPFTSDTLAGLEHVALNNTMPSLGGRPVAAVNMSLGGGSFTSPCDGQPHKLAIDNLRAAGIATVVSSGNDGSRTAISSPACISTAVAIGSTDDGSNGTTADAISFFSNMGNFGNLLLAPGEWILSSVPGGDFEMLRGTSMAAPHAAGAFALLRQQAPAGTVTNFLNVLRNTGLPIHDARSGGLYTKPRIRIGYALSAVAGDAVKFQAATFNEPEAAGSATITVVRTGSLAGTTAVHFATSNGTALAGVHYAATSGTLTFGPGESSKTFTVGLIDNKVVNPNRTVNLALTSPVGGSLGTPSTAVLTILNDDNGGTIAFSQPSYSVAENAGPVTITVNRTGTNLAGAVTVPFSTANGTAIAGTDYTAKTGTLTFGEGETSKTFTVSLINDAVLEPDKKFKVTLGAPGGGGTLGAPSTADVTIMSEDTAGTVQFSSAAYSVNEGAGAASITVTRTGTNLAGGVRVAYAATNGTALAGSDFTTTSGTLTFAGGVRSMTFTVPIINDLALEPTETVNLVLTIPAGSAATLGSPSTAVLSIVDNDAPVIQFALAAQSVAEGSAASVVVTRANSLSIPVSASYEVVGGTATGGGVDYTLASGTVSFGAGVTSATIRIPTVNDTLVEGPETIILRLSNPSPQAKLGARTETTVTIVDNDFGGTIAFGAATYSVAENAASGVLNIPVVRTGVNLGSNVTVDYAVTGGTATGGGVDYTLGGTLTFAAGQTTRFLSLTLVNDDFPEGNERVVITLSNPSPGAKLGLIKTTTVTILDDEQAVAFTAPAYSVTEGVASIAIPIVRAGPVPGGVTITCRTVAGGTATAGVDFTAVNTTLAFAAGSRTVNCVVPIRNDTIVNGPRTVHLELSVPSGSPALLAPQSTTVLTINDNDQGGTLRFSVAAASVAEGATATVTVLRSGTNLASGVAVDYAVTGGTAVNGADYTLANGTLTFAAGVTSRSFLVPTGANTVVNGARTIVITLSNPTGGASLGAPASTTLTIVDNDFGGTIAFGAATYSVAENAAGAVLNIPVVRTGVNLASNVTVDYAVAGGTATNGVDYTLADGSLTFAAGQTTRFIPLTLLDDTLPEGNETVVITLSNPSPGAKLGLIKTTTVTIREDEQAVAFAAPAYSVTEGVASIAIPIVRAGPVPGGVTITCRTVDGGTAIPGVDFTAVNTTLAFAAGSRTVNCVVPIRSDTLADGPRTVHLELSVPTGSPALLAPQSTTVLTINDNDHGGTIAFGAATYTVVEGKSVTLAIKRTGTNLASNVTVDYAVTGGTAANGADFSLPGGTLTFNAGETQKTLVIPIVEDGVTEGSQTFVVTLSNVGGGGILGLPASTTVTIRDAARVRFVNQAVLCDSFCHTFTARLTTAQGRRWDSLSGVSSPEQPVPEPVLTSLVVRALEFGLVFSFSGSFTISPQQRYAIVLTADSAGNPVLRLFSEGTLTIAGAGSGEEMSMITTPQGAIAVQPGVRFEPLRSP